MKPHPRIRKTIKWGGAAVTALLVGVWIASAWCGVDWLSGHLSVCIDQGSLRIIPDGPGREPGEPDGWVAWMHPFSLGWTNTCYTGDGLIVYLWVPTMITCAFTALAWRLDLRAHAGFCPKCNYDRTGITAETKCPECGAMPMSR